MGYAEGMTSDDSAGSERAQPITTTWLVVRHAESTANAGAYFASQSDSPLSERGEQQTLALAAALASITIDAVFSSDLSRARRTVEPLASARGLPVVTREDLRERAMGELTGLTFEEAKRRHPDVWAKLVARDPHVAPPGGESHVALGARVRAALSEIGARHRGRTILIGSHGGTIHHVVRQLIGIHDLDAPPWLSVDNASVTRVDVVEPAEGVVLPRLAYLNRIAHGDGRTPFGGPP